jgi:molybdate transport system substrate-binding protein
LKRELTSAVIGIAAAYAEWQNLRARRSRLSMRWWHFMLRGGDLLEAARGPERSSPMTRLLAFAIAVLALAVVPASAAELKVISGPATAGVLAQLTPQFERETSYKVTEKGGVTGVLKQLIESGEPFDLALIPAPLMDSFAKQGKILANSNVPFVRVGMGVAVRAGATKPDVSSVAGLKQTILNAKSITFVPTGEAANQLSKVLKDFGIEEQVKAKLHPQQTVADCIKSVANGEDELYISLTNIIASGKGIALAGPFPSELQHYLSINAGVSASAKEPNGAKALIKLLTSETAKPVIRAKGLEPVAL